MQALKAFVGHSFSEDDKIVVSIILEHLNTLQKTYPGFSWDHAEDAASARVPDKIMAKIEGKNVFIGICTKNERAIRDTSLKENGFWGKGRVSADKKDLQWKTSDWIVQEIGLALGRNMKIVLLLEEEVREPGGLYGDLEYIRFARANPYASFGRLLQMLSSISPPEVQPSESKAPAAQEKTDVLVAADDDETREPQQDWTEESYRRAMIHCILSDDLEGIEKVDKAFRTSKFAAGMGEVEWEGRIEWIRLLATKQADFPKLIRLADENPQSSILRSILARAYARLGEHEKAAQAFQVAASTASDEKDRASNTSHAAIQLARAGKMADALSIMEQLRQSVRGKPTLQRPLMEDLRTLAQLEKDATLEIALLEHMVELLPTDTTLRFHLAYKHSQSGHEDMALLHYTKIPRALRDSSTWNNLGVVYGSFKMHTKGVEAFRIAEREGETLAMSNIGNKLLAEGFLAETKALVDKALGIEDYHPNIPDLLKRVTEAPGEEDKKEDEILDKVKVKAAFYRQLGHAALIEAPTSISGEWKAPECTLKATIQERAVRFSGSYEIDSSSIANLLAGMSSAPKQKEVRRIEYSLKVRGGILVGKVTRTTDGRQVGLLDDALAGNNVEMYFNDDRSEIYVMELPGAESKFYSLKKLN